jgi:hypothetical protein
MYKSGVTKCGTAAPNIFSIINAVFSLKIYLSSEQEAPDDREFHRSLQNCGLQYGTCFFVTLLVPDFRGGS